MKRYQLSATDLAQYSALTEAERQAWLHPLPDSYHSIHVERMGTDIFRWRDSREAAYYIGTSAELTAYSLTMRLRKLDPEYENHVQALRLLSQDEIDDLLSDL